MPRSRTLGRRFPVLVKALVALGALSSCGAATPVLSVRGGRLEGRGPDGASLDAWALVGTELELRNHLDRPIRVRIDGVQPDPAGPLTMYEVSRLDDTTGQWVPHCERGRDGLRLAVPLPGRWRPHEAAAGGRDDRRPPPLVFVEDPHDFTLTCTSGTNGKCARMGYLPGWTTAGGESLTPYFEACVRMMRADYCGDGHSYTVPGVPVDLHDRANRRTRHDRDMSFEAVWGAGGAVCVRRPRDPSRASLMQIAERCPRLADAVGERCHEGVLDTRPDALLVNRSPTPESDRARAHALP